MLFSAVAAGMAHPQALADILHNPVLAEGLFNKDTFPWQQVGAARRLASRRRQAAGSRQPGHGPALGAAVPRARPGTLRHPGFAPGLPPLPCGTTCRRAASLLPAPRTAVPQVLYCGLLTTDLALMMEVFALQDVSSVDAAIIYTLEPVLGAAFAWVLLGERIGSTGMVGAVIILASSLFSQVMGGGGEAAAEEPAALPAASKDE